MLGLGRGRQAPPGPVSARNRSRSAPPSTATKPTHTPKHPGNGGSAITARQSRVASRARPPATASRSLSAAAPSPLHHSLPTPAKHRQQRGRMLMVLYVSVTCLGVLAATMGGGWGRALGMPPLLTAATSSSSRSSIVTTAVATGSDLGNAGSTAPGSVRLSVIAPLQQASPFGVSWQEVLEQTAQRLAWADPAFKLVLHDSAPLAPAAATAGDSQATAALLASLRDSQAAVAVGVMDDASASALAPLLAAVPTVIALGSSQALQGAVRLGGRPLSGGSKQPGLLQRFFPDKQAKADEQVVHTVNELYQRASSDDFLFIFLVLANSYIKEVPAVSMSFKQKNAGLEELKCMVGKCGGEIFRCVTDSTCKSALDCLQGCEFNDQVCSYRCITSYESQLLEEFSLCIIQKHNCFGLSAEIPMVPDPAPLTSWAGQPLTHELAEDLFIGWLEGDPSSSLKKQRQQGGTKRFSWRVFAGKNAAYDFFPCQFQLFYRGKGKGGMWYDPAFQVKTVDGRTVWRRRHYRVKRDKTPGTFRFSVLDNGVTSSEYWRILECDEALDWCVFYYSGAASRAGLSYSGAILASKSGDWPASQEARQRIEVALDAAGIKPWELSNVDNSNCAGAPLDPSLMALA